MRRKRTILNYPVIVESCQEGGYFADCPSLQGCHVQGETIEEALVEIKHAIEAYIEDAQAHHLDIPRPAQAIITTIPIPI